MTDRREFLRSLSLLALGSYACFRERRSPPVLVNDIHSQLNETPVWDIVQPVSEADVQRFVQDARRSGRAVATAGGRHAMGGQQFAGDALLIDTRRLARVLKFDAESGRIEVEAGIEWPQLVEQYLAAQEGRAKQWGFAQKQTGADRLTIGGTMAANAHGRGLTMRPFVADVASFRLVDANGDIRQCSRTENRELFRLVHGGYGLFGVVTSATLTLVPRRKVQRIVEVITIDKLMPSVQQRVAAGFEYGDFQFAIDPKSPDFLHRGVFSCYRAVSPDTPVPTAQKELKEDDWRDLLYLAHADKTAAFQRYSTYYMSTSGQVYWSDTHQMSIYPDGYHRQLDARLGVKDPGTEMITEIYVPRPQLVSFLAEAAEDFRKNAVEPIYGTVRFIEKDDESFLAWAKHAYACIIFNLHVVHTEAGRAHAAEAFRRLIDMAIRRSGSYYLTYHRWARREQVVACYPQFPEFLRLKREYDPEERFQSEWYRHYRSMFADAL